jgi:hypothetical protein
MQFSRIFPKYFYHQNPFIQFLILFLIHKSIRIDFLLLYLISAQEIVSARPPLSFSSPAAAHLLPPSPAQSAIATLVRFLYYITCPIWPSLADRWAHPVSEPRVVIRTCPFCKTCPIRQLRPQAIARTLDPLSPFGPAGQLCSRTK